MWSRRAFLQNTGVLGATALTARVNGVGAIARAAQSVAGRTPEDVASDETFWREIQFSFTLDRALTNLNNGDSSPAPRVVHEALKRYLDFSNQLPFYYRGQLARNLETVRRRLADESDATPRNSPSPGMRAKGCRSCRTASTFSLGTRS